MPHALLSASGASRWMACTPSARLEEQFPESTSSYAEEGTLAHELADTLCRYKTGLFCDLSTELENISKSPLYNTEMYDYIDRYSDYVNECFMTSRSYSSDAVIETEVRLDLRKYIPDGFGTSDIVVIADGVMQIIDLKYGKGVPVSAENNKQMMLYALGALDKYDLLYDISVVNMTIYQPRLDNISVCEMPVEDLLNWAETILREKAALAFDGAGEYQAGEHCRFCRAKGVCRARAEENLKLACYEFKQADLLAENEIADILKVADNLKNWADDVAAFALDQAVNQGVHYEGWKVVEGRSNRIYTDPKKVEDKLKSEQYTDRDIFNIKLKGIGDIEKLMGKKRFQTILGDFIVRPQGKPTLAPETDGRPEWNSAVSAALDFANTEYED